MVNARARDRAQLLLVGAVVLSIVVIGTATAFNSMIQTASTSPQGTSIGSSEAATYGDIVTRDLQRLVNALAEDGVVDRSALAANTTRYSHKLAVVAAEGGPIYLNVSLNDTASDSRVELVQTTDQHVVNESSAHDWTPVDSGRIEAFEMTLDPNDPNIPNSEPQAFALVVRNASAGTSWGLRVWKDSSGPGSGVVRIQLRKNGSDAGGPHEFNSTNDIHVNETHIVGKSNTTAIAFADGVDPSYTLRIENGNKIKATYEIRADGGVDEGDFHDESAGSQPYADTVLTTASMDLDYESPSLSYEGSFSLPVGGDPTPHSGAVLLYSNFEGGAGGLGPEWTHTGGGSAGVDGQAAHTGGFGAFHTGPGDGELATTGAFDTSGYDRVVVAFWAMEGYPTVSPGPDHGPEPGEGENMSLQYWNGSSWIPVDSLPAVDGDTVAYDRRVVIDAPGASHPAFRIRFVAPADAPSDRWYVDDVMIRGKEAP